MTKAAESRLSELTAPKGNEACAAVAEAAADEHYRWSKQHEADGKDDLASVEDDHARLFRELASAIRSRHPQGRIGR